MKKIIEEYYCDDCEKRIFDIKDSFTITFNMLGEKTRRYMLLCTYCVSERLLHSLHIEPSIRCAECNGKGYTETTYYHNEKERQTCIECCGSGRKTLVKPKELP